MVEKVAYILKRNLNKKGNVKGFTYKGFIKNDLNERLHVYSVILNHQKLDFLITEEPSEVRNYMACFTIQYRNDETEELKLMEEKALNTIIIECPYASYLEYKKMKRVHHFLRP